MKFGSFLRGNERHPITGLNFTNPFVFAQSTQWLVRERLWESLKCGRFLRGNEANPMFNRRNGRRAAPFGANMCCLNAAWAPEGLREAPGWPWQGSSSAAWIARRQGGGRAGTFGNHMQMSWGSWAFHEGSRRPLRGSSGAAWRLQNVGFQCVFISSSCFACILRFGSCSWRLAAPISCEDALFEGGAGAMSVP